MAADNEGRDQVEGFAARLRDAGVKVTHQRLVILRETAAAGSHPDVETVYRAVRQELPTVSLDTVYRALHLFADLGLIGTLGLSGGRVRFDPNTGPHHHLVCSQCGEIQDFEEPGFDHLGLPASAAGLGSVDSAHVELRGLCAHCVRARRSKTSSR
jgi:Fur family transcriptional regulator, peroxide stress response regulator